MTELEHKRKQRVKQTAECFTPPKLVSEMLDKLPEEVWAPEKLWLDNSAGNGAFLVEVLKRKLDKGHDPLIALSTIYATELMNDNVEEMKSRLLKLLPLGTDLSKAQKIIDHNIVQADALKFDFDNWCKKSEKKARSLF